jgi:DNA-binding transcriptional ArsR family regulator
VLTHAEPVRVTGDMTVNGFAAEVLRVVTHVRASQSAGGGGDPPAGAREPDAAVAFWRRVGRLLEGEDVLGGGLSVAGVGASVSRGRIAAERRDVSLYPELAQAIAYLAGAGTGERRPGRARGRAAEPGRVLLHVNNFENLTRADTARAAGLVQDLRDYFLIPHSHWVFVGAADLEQTVFRASEAVSGIVPLVADLPPLAPEEVTALLALRYERLRLGLRFTPPVAPDDAVALYRRYAGDLRNFLRLLSNAVQRTPVVGRPAPLTARAVVQTMAEPYRRALAQRLGEVDLAHLAALAAGGAPGLRVRPADVAQRTGLAKASVTELLARLESRGAVRYDRTEGRNTYYRLRPDTEIAFGLL